MLATRLKAVRTDRDVLDGIAADYRAFRLDCAYAAIRTALEASSTARALGGARQACAALGSLGPYREYASEVAELHEFIRLRSLRDKLMARKEAELLEARAIEAINLLNDVLKRASGRFMVVGDIQTNPHQGLLDILLTDDQCLKAATLLASQGKLALVDMSLSLGLHTATKDALTRGSPAFCELLWRQPYTVPRLLFYLFGFSQGPLDSRRLLLQLEMLLFRYATDPETGLLAFLRKLDGVELEVMLPDAPSTITQKILAFTQRIVAGADARLFEREDGPGKGFSGLLDQQTDEGDVDLFLEASKEGVRDFHEAETRAETETHAIQERLLQRFTDEARRVLSGQFSKPLQVHFDTHFDITRCRFRLEESQTLGRLIGRLYLSTKRLFGLGTGLGTGLEHFLTLVEDVLMRMLHSSRFVAQMVVFEIDSDVSRERKTAINRLGEYLTVELGVLAVHAQHFRLLDLLSCLHIREFGRKSDALELQRGAQRRKVHRTLRETTTNMLKQALLEPELLPSTLLALRDFVSDLSWHPTRPEDLELHLQTSLGASVLEAFLHTVLVDEKPLHTHILPEPLVIGLETLIPKPFPESSKVPDFVIEGVYRTHGNEYPESTGWEETAIVSGIALRRLKVFHHLLRTDLQVIIQTTAFLGVWTPQEAIRLLRRRFGEEEKEEKDLLQTIRWLKAHHSSEPRPNGSPALQEPPLHPVRRKVHLR